MWAVMGPGSMERDGPDVAPVHVVGHHGRPIYT